MPRAKKTTEPPLPTGPMDDRDELHQGWTAQAGVPLEPHDPVKENSIYENPSASGVNPEQYEDTKGLTVTPSEKDSARQDGKSGAAFTSSSDNVPSDASLKDSGVSETYSK